MTGPLLQLRGIGKNFGVVHAAKEFSFSVKLFAVAVSDTLAGLAGALYAHYIGFLNPEPFGVDQSLNAILAVILSGNGTLAGPVVGAFAITFLPENLRIADSYRLVTHGIILVVATIFMPHGLVPVFYAIGSRLRSLMRRGYV